MKFPVRVILAVMCIVLIASIPFFLSSPYMLPDAQEELVDNGQENEDEIVLDFGRLFLSSAMAEEDLEVEDVAMDGKLTIPDDWALPYDFSIPPMPDPEKYTEEGYEDQSIRVRIETREMFDSEVNIAFVEIAHPSQLRTATAAGVSSQLAKYLKTIARENHAVVAINGDDFIKDAGLKSFEVRMGQLITYDHKRNKPSKERDTLIIDKNADFHIFQSDKAVAEYFSEHKDEIVNAYTFGPGLVVDGMIRDMTTAKGWNGTRKEPRSAIGQTGPLSYVMVVVKGRGKSKGVNQEELAEIMKDLGCIQAYNLDGGNSAQMCVVGPDPEKMMYEFDGQNGKRGQTDILYFSTAVPEEERQ